MQFPRRELALVLGLYAIYAVFNFWPHPKVVEAPVSSGLSQTIYDYLEIPKISVSAPIIFSKSAEENDIQESLSRGVVHYPGTAQPGEIGNVYIVGHSSDYVSAPGEYKTIFARLPELGSGDEITITGTKRLIYTVTDTKVVEADDLSVVSQATSGRKLLTLQTSYPVGTAEKRLVVIAELAYNILED